VRHFRGTVRLVISCGPRPDLWPRVYRAGEGAWNQTSLIGTAVSVAARLCGTGDWIHPSRVSEPCDRPQRTLSASDAHGIQFLSPYLAPSSVARAKTHHKADRDKLPTKVPSSKFGKSVDCIITTNAGLPDTRSQSKMNHLTVVTCGLTPTTQLPFTDELINCEPKLLSCCHERFDAFRRPRHADSVFL
jgi:hypothetical protein